MSHDPYIQRFDMKSGETLYLNVDVAPQVYLMTVDNLIKYCDGRTDYEASYGMPFQKPVELMAGDDGFWYVVSEYQLEGGWKRVRGNSENSGSLSMERFSDHKFTTPKHDDAW